MGQASGLGALALHATAQHRQASTAGGMTEVTKAPPALRALPSCWPEESQRGIPQAAVPGGHP